MGQREELIRQVGADGVVSGTYLRFLEQQFACCSNARRARSSSVQRWGEATSRLRGDMWGVLGSVMVVLGSGGGGAAAGRSRVTPACRFSFATRWLD